MVPQPGAGGPRGRDPSKCLMSLRDLYFYKHKTCGNFKMIKLHDSKKYSNEVIERKINAAIIFTEIKNATRENENIYKIKNVHPGKPLSRMYFVRRSMHPKMIPK